MLAATIALAVAPIASQAAPYVGNPPPVVQPGGQEQGPPATVTTANATVLGEVVTRPPAVRPSRAQAPVGALALTGADVLQLTAIGALLVGLGATLVRRARRRTT